MQVELKDCVEKAGRAFPVAQCENVHLFKLKFNEFNIMFFFLL